MYKQYIPFDSFLVRTPSLPFSYKEIIDSDFYQNVFFHEAIYIASYDLFQEMSKLLANENLSAKDSIRLRDSLSKYWKRMKSRTTPYGLFSGVTIGQIVPGNLSKITFTDNIIRHIRLDMQVIYSIVDVLEKNDTFLEKLIFFPNDTLYRIHNEMRYYERIFKDKSFEYSLSKITYTSLIKNLLDFLAVGKTLNEIALFIYKVEPTIELEDIKLFVQDLLKEHVIISELNPGVTSGDALKTIIEIINNRDKELKELESLLEIQQSLKNINFGLEIPESYKKIKTILKEEFFIDNKNLFQIDLYKEAKEACINISTIDEVLEAVLFLKDNFPRPISNEPLAEFKKYFIEKYEGQEISLLMATDPDIGIGYPVQLNDATYTNDLIKKFHTPKKLQTDKSIQWNKSQDILFSKVVDNLSNNENEMFLDEKDFASIPKKYTKEFYPTFYCNFEIINGDAKARLLKLNTFGGSSGANLLARFSHTHNAIEELVRDITKKEQEVSEYPIFEILHVTSPRIGNVLTRSHLRDFELTILCTSNKNSKHTIPISDLMISIKDDKIHVRSKTLNQFIKISNTNAFNHDLSTIPGFNLLCDLL